MSGWDWVIPSVLAGLSVYALFWFIGVGSTDLALWVNEFENPELVAQWCADVGNSMNSTRCK